MQGTIIVIEGTNGAGKSTQFKLLNQRLKDDGYEVATVKFPRYDEPSSYFVRQYLSGEYGSAEEVGPYTGSLFYALDRFAAAATIREAVEAGKVVILDRYVGSNMAHQGTKFHHAEERRGFFIWLDNLEFELLRIPRPTRSFVLRVPTDVSLKQLEARTNQTGQAKDLHEADTEHLQRSLDVYDDLCQLFPKDFTRIDCDYQHALLPIETIHELLWRHVAPLLPPKPAVRPEQHPGQPTIDSVHTAVAADADAIELPLDKQPQETPDEAVTVTEEQSADSLVAYFIPPGLPEEITAQYKAHLERILELHHELKEKLTTHLHATGTTDEAADAANRAAKIADAVLPLASLVGNDNTASNTSPLQELIAGQEDRAARDFAVKYLPGQHAAQTNEQAQLISRLPRNELDALPDILYPHSSLTLRELQVEVGAWTYDRKAEIFEATAKEHAGAIQGLEYTWDIVSSVGDFATVASRVPAAVSHQACSPRYGYNVPEIIEDAGLGDQFEACFDISLGLYSLLQETGRGSEAQYAVLAGHTLRWKLTLRSNAFAHLYHALPDNKLMQQLKATVTEAHPLLGEAIT